MEKIISYLDFNIVNKYKDKLFYIKNNFDVFYNELINIPLKYFNNYNINNNENNYWFLYGIKKANLNIDDKKLAVKTFNILKHANYYNVFVSVLKSKNKINLHKDNLGSYLYRSHLGLSVPDDYKFICNNNDITTKNNDINFFDSSDEHYGFNNSNDNRIVLIIDILKDEYVDYFNNKIKM